LTRTTHDPQSQPKTTSQRPAVWDRLGIVPGRVFRACGMRRSGNHAIANWLQRNAPLQSSVFLNNCKPGKNPLDSFSSIEINATRGGANQARTNLPKATGSAGDGALFLFSYEDASPLDFTGNRALSGDFDENLITTDLLIYRGFLNWCASLLKKLQRNPIYSLSRRISIILKAIDTYSRLLMLVADNAQNPDQVCICYDQWASGETYRADILQSLQLPSHDNSLGPVQPYGGGSSFQKSARSPDELQTNRRWQQMAQDPEFLAVLYLAAQDTALTDALSHVFPQDCDRLAAFAAQNTLSTGGMA